MDEQPPNKTAPTSDSLWQAISANATNLSLLAIAMAGLLAVAFISTKETIRASETQARYRALLTVMPRDLFDDAPLALPMPAPQQLNEAEGSAVYVAKTGNQINGWIIPATTKAGYNGTIKLLVGITAAGNITGVRVIQHKETPGLGDKIERKKSPWIDDFIGAQLSERNWKVRKDGGDFDQFTGATITPRAVVMAIEQVLVYYQAYQAKLFDLAHNNK